MRDLHNREDLTALLELRDIEDELKTLEKLFDEQIAVLDAMIAAYKKIDDYYDTNNPTSYAAGRNYAQYKSFKDDQEKTQGKVLVLAYHSRSIAWLKEAKTSIEKYKRQAEIMCHSCISVQEAVSTVTTRLPAKS